MGLIDKLLALKTIWVDSTGRTSGALATLLANDGKFFTRIEAGSSLSIATYERMIGWFAVVDNWPDGRLPDAAALVLASVAALTAPLPLGEAA